MLGEKVPTGVGTPFAGSLVGPKVVNAVPALGALVLSAGDYYLHTVGANITLQVQDEGGVWNNITAAGVGATVTADGVNVRLANAAGAVQNATTQKLG